MTSDYNSARLARTTAIVTALSTFVAFGCSKQKDERTSAGSVDTAALTLSTSTPAAGPGVRVTAGDTKSVRQAAEYELTEENFARFLRAADSLQVLQARDTAARTLLVVRDTIDMPTREEDAGVKRLESNPMVNNAIASAGLSVRDYFVMAIAIASAERFMANPQAAPPTPATQHNAEFLRAKSADLAHLRALRSGTAPVKVTQ